MTNQTIKTCERYLGEILGFTVKPKPLPRANTLPFYLTNLYDFYVTSLSGMPPFWMLVNKNEDELTPGTIERHLQLIRQECGFRCIYVSPAITAYNRKRMIERKIPFIVPETQLYFPEMAIDLREQFRVARNAFNATLSPASQAVVICALRTPGIEGASATSLAKILDYSVMTMARALDELEAADLCEMRRDGKNKRVYFGEDKRALWEKALPRMRNPVKRRVWLKENTVNKVNPVRAGFTALAQYSMLAPRFPETYAIGAGEWKAFEAKGGIEQFPYPEEGCYELEVWSYNPRLFAEDGTANRFSVYLSLQSNDNDERTEQALRTMVEGFLPRLFPEAEA